MPKLNDLIVLRHELAQQTRAYVKDQVETWAKIPWAALMADGRTGFSDRGRLIYQDKIWPLNEQIGVDCLTGDLVFTTNKRIVKEDISLVSLSFITNLTASTVLEALERQAKQAYPSYYDPKVQEEWRARMIAAYFPERVEPNFAIVPSTHILDTEF